MSGLKTLEHVAVTVSITHPRRGSLEVKLFCPSGMMSLIGAPRSLDSYVLVPLPSELSLQRGPCPGKDLGGVDTRPVLNSPGVGFVTCFVQVLTACLALHFTYVFFSPCKNDAEGLPWQSSG